MVETTVVSRPVEVRKPVQEVKEKPKAIEKPKGPNEQEVLSRIHQDGEPDRVLQGIVEEKTDSSFKRVDQAKPEVQTEEDYLRLDTGVKIDRGNKTALVIEEEIKKNGGRIPYSKFMELSLFSPEGYYASGNVKIGYEGDFITSPEASEIYGATLGKTAMRVWEAMGKPEIFRIVEMGAGKGALAYSLLRWTEKLNPEFYKAIRYTVLEYGAGLIPQQQNRLTGFDNIQWVRGSAYELPFRDVEGIFISNELPDAFPVEVVTLINGQVKQKNVALENDIWVEVWGEPTAEVTDYINKYKIGLHEGIEEPVNLQAVRLQNQLDQALKRGGVITVDYGKNGEVGERETGALRFYSTKVKESTSEDVDEYQRTPYIKPGVVDITASINFRVLEQLAKEDGLQVGFSGLQRDLLLKTGVTDVVKRMKKAFGESNSWKDIVALSRGFHGYQFLVQGYESGVGAGMGDFYSHLLLKGIDPKAIKLGTPSRMLDLNSPRVPLSIGKANRDIKLDFSEVPASEYFTNYQSSVSAMDSAGRIWLSPALMEGLRVYSGHDLLFDFTDQKQLQHAVQKMGYTFD